MANKALGRGLEALLTPIAIESASSADAPQSVGEQIAQIRVSQIKANKYQPRLDFNQEKLNELISSIKEKGIIQPILVRKTADGFELIAGERRLRAAQTIGMEKIPAIIRNVADIDMLEISLIENIQREELNPVEEACAFQKLVTDFNFTQEDIAKSLGKDRSTIANAIRLLGLAKKIQDYISKGAITAGHAKALLSLPTESDQLRVCNLIVKKGLSVRETESIVAHRSSGAKRRVEAGKEQGIIDIEGQLQQLFGTRVRIIHGKKRGRIQIEYYSTEDMNRILDMLNAAKKP
ncbi:MAG: ParB/RepB/Spo0J family partition protein [Candidatus Omnitrophica bacterium]|nr:ParB/RepB/Spo0J family partition protein [Candidatus Omnitrophota bacterium]MBU0895169.1 ParB/RepB/Spo0J family partition protein [Candidatus Omnitrophota bacterium]